MANFERSISDGFFSSLRAEAAKGGWWHDVLNDPDLLVALRGDYLNVYRRGQSLFTAWMSRSALKVSTHEKFLLDPELNGQVLLEAGGFDINELMQKAFVKCYDKAALGKIKKAADFFAGEEKIGCHRIALANCNVIDVEINFTDTVTTESGEKPQTLRFDFAALEPMDDRQVRLVFWEAKHFSNGDLAAEGDNVPVLRQVAGYKEIIARHRAQLEASYQKVAKTLVAFKEELGWKRPLSPLFEDVASGRKTLTLGEEPKVGLLIFGFDAAQRDHPGWQAHLRKLKDGIKDVKAAGKAGDIHL